MHKAHDLPSLFLVHKYLMETDLLLIMRNIAAFEVRGGYLHHTISIIDARKKLTVIHLEKKQRHLKYHIQIQMEQTTTVFGTINGPFS